MTERETETLQHYPPEKQGYSIMELTQMPLLTHPPYHGHLLVEGQRKRGQSQRKQRGLAKKKRDKQRDAPH